MTPEFAKKYLPFITALAEGKQLQFNYGTKKDPDWSDIPSPSFSGPPEDYRIKPKPVERYFFVCADGLMSYAYMTLDMCKKSTAPINWVAIYCVKTYVDERKSEVVLVEENKR